MLCYCNSGLRKPIVLLEISSARTGPSDINFRKAFSDVCSQKVEDDGLTFLPDTIRVERIRDEEAYEGVRVRVAARLGDVRIPLQIDVGLGDTIVPASEELDILPRIPAPKLHAYSKESVVAEKFEAMVKLGVANSRMKDFYDLWILAKRFEFVAAILRSGHSGNIQDAAHESTEYSSPLALRAEFYELPAKQAQWGAFLRKSRLKADSSLKEIVEVIREFVMPVVDGVLKGERRKPSLAAGRPVGERAGKLNSFLPRKCVTDVQVQIVRELPDKRQLFHWDMTTTGNRKRQKVRCVCYEQLANRMQRTGLTSPVIHVGFQEWCREGESNPQDPKPGGF